MKMNVEVTHTAKNKSLNPAIKMLPGFVATVRQSELSLCAR